MQNVIDIATLTLSKGSHTDPANGLCIMEAVAYFNGEPFSDRPECVCPTITDFLISWNDASDYLDRQELKKYIPLVAGTRGTKELALRRSYMVADWFVRVYLPAWLNLASIDSSGLKSLPECTDAETLHASDVLIYTARSAAWLAAWLAARSAAWSAAWSAAESAVESALNPTRIALRQSAFDLLDRMIALKDSDADKAS